MKAYVILTWLKCLGYQNQNTFNFLPMLSCRYLALNFFFCLFWTAFTLETRSLTYHEFYYEYVPDRLQWTSAGELCNQRSGALATVTNSEENRNLTTFLKSLNISEPVWIARKVMTYLTSRFSMPFVYTSYQHMSKLFLNSRLIVCFVKVHFCLLTD